MHSKICFLSLLVVSFVGTAAAAQDRIVRPVDPAKTVILKGHLHPKARPQDDLGAADPGMALGYVTILMKPAAGIETFLDEQQNPASPSYHKWLTPEQFGDRFGLTQSDAGKVTAWLRSQGLKVNDVARGRHWTTFSGTAQQVGRAFHTEFHRYLVNGREHFANATDISIPDALESVIGGIDGLNDFALEPMMIKAHPPAEPSPDNNVGSSHALVPDDLAAIYNINTLYNSGIDGTGQKVAIIGRTAINLADIRKFRSTYGLNSNDPQLVLFGNDPGTSAGDLPEADIDLEWSGAVARNATIIYVYSTSVNTSAQYAIDQNLAPVMSMSYGSCEAENTTAFRVVAQQANAQGITWFVSSGDSGADTCDRNAPTPQAYKGATQSAPASFPEVTAVGGTEFNDGNGAGFWAATNSSTGGSALGYVPERAWNDSNNNLEGTGGGPSALYPKPSWQTGPGVPNDNARDLPDISLPASPQHYPSAVYTGGNLAFYGGTSVSSPAWAGILALVNQSQAAKHPEAQPGLGNINPALYRLAQATTDVFHDITVGDNKVPCVQSSPGCVGGLVGFAASAGYDMATGLGSVDVAHLVNEWDSGTASTTSITANPSTVKPGDTVQLTAVVAGVSGGAVPSGAVDFLAASVNLGSAPLTSSGGKATATLTAPAALIVALTGTVEALYSGDKVYTGSAGSATLTLTAPASGSQVVPFVTPFPVYPAPTSGAWNFSVVLAEKAGVATTLTGFTINGTAQNLALWSSTKISPKGTISASLAGSVTPPVNRVFVFSGTDGDGTTWTQQLTVPFLAAIGTPLVAGMTLTSPNTTVQQNPQADPSCQWQQQVTLQEQGGFLMTLARFTDGATDLTGQIQQLFGTTRLAPYGALRAGLCFSGSTPPATKAYQITGISEIGVTTVANLSTTFAAAPATSAKLSASQKSITLLSAGAGKDAIGNLSIDFAGGAPQWSASVSPSNRTSGWLTVSPASGNGAAQLTLTASGAALSPGAYFAVLSIQATNSVPQVVNVPVAFVVGSSNSISITQLQNAFSFQSAFAPGMAAAVYGTGLSPATATAPRNRFPLPLSLAGVSATVNGVSAPLYFISPSQINFQIPYEVSAGPALVAVNNNGAIASFFIDVAVTAPGLYVSAIDNTSGAAVQSAKRGQILLLFMTGEGDATPTLATGATPSSTITDPTKLPHPRLPVVVTVGGVPANVLFAGIPNGVAGLTQVDITMPAETPSGAQPVVVTVGGVASQPITLTVLDAQ